jgi:hypothetical protein
MTSETIPALHEFLEIEVELEGLQRQKNDLTARIEPLLKRRASIIETWGRSGRTFRVGGVILQANAANEYASLRRIIVEEA